MSSKPNNDPDNDQANKKLEQIEQIVNLPAKYKKYNKDLLTKFFHLWKISSQAKQKGIDPSMIPESQITIDLADRNFLFSPSAPDLSLWVKDIDQTT